MKLCIISPISGLQRYATLSEGVHLALIHLVEESDEYAKFYRHRSEMGDRIILDNGAFEFGQPCTGKRLLDAADKIKAHVLVAPDYPGQPWEKSVIAAEKFCDDIRKTPYKAMGCPQSIIGDYRGWLKGVRSMAQLPHMSHIGISILATPNAFGPMLGNRSDIEACRLLATFYLKDAISASYVQLQGKKLHYLGAGHRLDLIRYYDIADSLDTSSPVWHGWQNIHYQDGWLPKGKSPVPVDFHAELPKINHMAAIMENIAVIKAHARLSEVKP